ncbi:MAG: hypothetical protein J07HX64_02926 [halophilic archaeon J07HX64]|nr:MAG: hypothetical protein J07HX64_02926 [halophilic archaeon J07HX64]
MSNPVDCEEPRTSNAPGPSAVMVTTLSPVPTDPGWSCSQSRELL